MVATAAEIIVLVAGVWIAIGTVFALAFTLVGVGRVDHAARGSGPGFRALIFPACVALWPLLLGRWLRADGETPQERNAHRRAAAGRRP